MKNSENKYKDLIRDTFLFAMSSFVPKAISFFLVPLYTNCLTTEEFGVVDVLTTTITLLVPILTLGIDNAVIRFTVENKEDKQPYKIAIYLVYHSFTIVFGIFILNCLFKIIHLDYIYQIYFIVNYMLTALYGINIAYLRATDRVKLLSITSIVNTIVVVVCNIFTLLVLNMGIEGYLLSNTFGMLIVNILVLYKINLKNIMRDEQINTKLRKDMIRYSLPLIASGIAWWINSVSDRYLVTYMCGIAANGIYSVAYKIPTVLQMVQSVFSQAWVLSMYREYNSKDGKHFVSKIFDLYSGGMSIVCSVLILLTIPLAKFLYAKEFFSAWYYVPTLLVSVVFIAYAGFFESILTLYKKSKVIAMTTVIGSVFNIILNVFLIYEIGPLGAAIATSVGYFIMWILRIPFVHKVYPFKVNILKQGMIIILLMMETFFMTVMQNHIICLFLMAMIMLLNINSIKHIMSSIIKKIKTTE